MYTLEKLSEKYSFPLFWCEMEEKIIQANVHWRVRSLVENSENAYFIKIKNFDEFVKKLRENYMIYSKLRRDKNGNLKKVKWKILKEIKMMFYMMINIYLKR